MDDLDPIDTINPNFPALRAAARRPPELAAAAGQGSSLICDFSSIITMGHFRPLAVGADRFLPVTLCHRLRLRFLRFLPIRQPPMTL